MTCRRSTLKKYQSRPSPPYPAQSCKGQTKKGNDGKKYVSAPSSKGVYRWVLSSTKNGQKKTEKKGKTAKKRKTEKKGKTAKSGKTEKKGKEYSTHNNGGSFFRVVVFPKKVEIYLNEWVEETESYVKGKKIFETAYRKIFIGDNDLPYPEAESPKGVDRGNTVLIHVSGSTYIFVGFEIISFETRDKEAILHYYSPMGGNDSPYPYAVGEKYSYFLLDYTTVPNDVLDLTKDGYTQYYGHPFRDQKRTDSERYQKSVIQPTIKPFRYKRVYKMKD